MNLISTVYLLVSAAALLLLPLRWAALPLLAGACYMSLSQGIELGGLNLPVIRLLIAAGVARVLIRGERLAGPINTLDYLILLWGAWAITSSMLHDDVPSTLVNRLGLVYNACGIYFLVRVFCRSIEDVTHLCRMTALLLIPLSLAMLVEHTSGRNAFSVLGGVNEFSEVRNGMVRAQGPFGHSILAGSVGAAALPLMFAIWSTKRVTAIAGMAACLLMVYCSMSSGPVMSILFAIAALVMWRWRHRMRMLRWLAVFAYISVDLLMKAPAYYLLARIDITGSSTSWHRAELINAATRHFPEWWLAGTDYTRHWLPYGVPWSADHIDITNYYINMGVYGGIPLMVLFVATLATGFAYVGARTSPPARQSGWRILPRQKKVELSQTQQFTMWTLGSSLFTHAATFISVSYFDQSVAFLYLTLAAISSGHLVTSSTLAQQPSNVRSFNRTTRPTHPAGGHR